MRVPRLAGAAILTNGHFSASMIMPRTKHTNVGDSEHPGGMKTYCSPSGHYDNAQGTLPGDFWTNVDFVSGNGQNGGRIAQRACLEECPSAFSGVLTAIQ